MHGINMARATTMLHHLVIIAIYPRACWSLSLSSMQPTMASRVDLTRHSSSLSASRVEQLSAQFQDNLRKYTYQIRSKYLFGCDGARSQVLRQLQIPLIKKPGQGLAINLLVKLDLEHVVENRRGNLHWVMRPDEESPIFGWSCIVRMVKPWNE